MQTSIQENKNCTKTIHFGRHSRLLSIFERGPSVEVFVIHMYLCSLQNGERNQQSLIEESNIDAVLC
jgi:hypothetical protein